MHVYFRICLMFLLLVCTVVQVYAENSEALAAYYKKVLSTSPELTRYVKQASEDPMGFKKTVRTDLIKKFKIPEEQLTDDLLLRYVNCETVSMHFMRTGTVGIKKEKLKALCLDKRLIIDFRIIPTMILAFEDKTTHHLAAQVIAQRNVGLRVFSQVKHKQFHNIAAAYLSLVYRSFLFQSDDSVRSRYLDYFKDWLIVLKFQTTESRYHFESIDLAVKLVAEIKDQTQRQQRIRELAAIVLASKQKEWQRRFAQACIQSKLDGFLEVQAEGDPK